MINFLNLNAWELKCLCDDLEKEQLSMSNKLGRTENETLRKIYDKECDRLLCDLVDIKRELERR